MSFSVAIVGALMLQSVYSQYECFYGNGGGLSPCAHTLPRDQSCSFYKSPLDLMLSTVPIDHAYDYSPPSSSSSSTSLAAAMINCFICTYF